MDYINTTILVFIAIIVTALAIRTFASRSNNTNNGKKGIICDSSALIDGRIVEVAKTGFLSVKLIIPSSVLREMQYLADNSDHEKRARARHGLDVVKELQALPSIETEILDDGLPGEGGVDERLITLCKNYKAQLLTLDFNLNKVAAAEGIAVLNVNQLAHSLRMTYLPGERRFITLVQKGQDASQAIGYLEDGTMVVVEKSSKEIGSSVEVEFTRALQTQAGRMLFAKKVHSAPRDKSGRSNQPKLSRKKSRKQSPEDNLVELANK